MVDTPCIDEKTNERLGGIGLDTTQSISTSVLLIKLKLSDGETERHWVDKVQQ